MRWLLVLTIVAAWPVAAAADPAAAYEAGDRLDPVVLEDQHGEEHLLGEDVRLVLFSRDMDGGDLIAEALEDGGAELLEARGAAYVADISGMPAIISRLFALPSMRRRPYAMWLDRDGTRTARLPDQPGKATLIHLAGGRITEVAHVDSAEAVRAALTAAPVTPGD